MNITSLHNTSKLLGRWKTKIVDEELPHYGRNSLFFQNDEITTGLMNNKTEIKIHLLTGQLLYFHNEEGFSVDLSTSDTSGSNVNIHTAFSKLLSRNDVKGLELPPEIELGVITSEELSEYYAFAVKVRRCLELYRMKLHGHYTLLHLWPEGFDFSVEWFTSTSPEEQIGVGISPRDDQNAFPYLYVNPYPFNLEVVKNELPLGLWHTDSSSWNGIKVEWSDLEYLPESKVAEIIYELFSISRKNFG